MLAEVWVVDLELLCWYQPQNTIFSREAPRESVSVALTVPPIRHWPVLITSSDDWPVVGETVRVAALWYGNIRQPMDLAGWETFWPLPSAGMRGRGRVWGRHEHDGCDGE